MDEILKLVRGAKRRLYCNTILKHLFDAALYFTIMLCLVVLFIKLIFFPGAFLVLAWLAATAAVLAALYALVASRLGLFEAAVAADDRLHLAERLSTVMLVSADPSPMAAAVVANARQHAREARYGEKFPVLLPTRSWRVAAAVVVLAGLFAMPQFDLFGRRALHEAMIKDKENAAREIAKVEKTLKAFKKSAARDDLETMELIDKLEMELAEMEKQGFGKKEILAAVSKMLEDIAERMKDVAKDLAEKESKDPKSLMSSAEREALKKASGTLAGIKKDLMKGNLTSKESRKLAEELEKMANQFAKQAQQLQKQMDVLQEKLGEEGLTPERAEQIKQAMQNLAQKAAATQQMASALSQACQAAQSGQCQTATSQVQAALSGMQGQLAGSEAAQQIQAMSQALSGLQQFKSNLTGAEAMSMAEAAAQLNQAYQAMLASGMCKGAGMCQGMGQGWGIGTGKGPGTGGRGQGQGGLLPVDPDGGTQVQVSSITGEMRQGRVLASFLTEGGMVKNESKVQYESVVLESQQLAKAALTNQTIPRAYERIVKDYFESLGSEE